jgi:hypothetical protein
VSQPRTEPDPVAAADAAHLAAARSQLGLLRALARIERTGAWRDAGARDLAHWASMRYGISGWKAHRWVGAARVLSQLPRVAGALGSGELGIDAAVELTRFATPATEAGLVAWARGVSPGAVRRRADREVRRSLEETRQTEGARFLDWWWTDEGRRLGLSGELPADQGMVVARAIERMAARVPVLPGEEGGAFDTARRADGLVALCAGGWAEDAAGDAAGPGAVRATEPPTIVVHAPLEALTGGPGELEGGGVVDPPALQRLGCDAKIQVMVEDASGTPLALGRTRREPSVAMTRALRHRDRECRFPGCGARRFTQAHHVVWWSRGGPTDLANLVLVCSFHHRLVHEHGWGISRVPDGEVRWFRPDGVRYRAGPAPPEQ